jgi:hypothetical protein
MKILSLASLVSAEDTGNEYENTVIVERQTITVIFMNKVWSHYIRKKNFTVCYITRDITLWFMPP